MRPDIPRINGDRLLRRLYRLVRLPVCRVPISRSGHEDDIRGSCFQSLRHFGLGIGLLSGIEQRQHKARPGRNIFRILRQHFTIDRRRFVKFSESSHHIGRSATGLVRSRVKLDGPRVCRGGFFQIEIQPVCLRERSESLRRIRRKCRRLYCQPPRAVAVFRAQIKIRDRQQLFRVALRAAFKQFGELYGLRTVAPPVKCRRRSGHLGEERVRDRRRKHFGRR